MDRNALALALAADVDALDAHLDELLAAPAPTTTAALPPPLDGALFDAVLLQLTPADTPPLVPRLLPKLVAALQGPAGLGASEAHAAVLCGLAAKLLGPVSFGDALTLAAEPDLVAALSADAAPATNLLALDVVHKAVVGSRPGQGQGQRSGPSAAPAAVAASNVARIAATDDLLPALVVRWLASPSVEVGERAGRVLGDLLDIDCPLPPPPSTSPPLVNGDRTPSTSAPAPATTTAPPGLALRTAPGLGRLWRRLLHDRAVYVDLLLALCRGTHPAVAHDGHPLQPSIAQGRVLRLLVRLAVLHLAEVATPAVDAQPSLLRFAVLDMVDPADELMRLSLVDFLETLVSVLRVAPAAAVPAAVLASAAAESTSATLSRYPDAPPPSGHVAAAALTYTADVLRPLLHTAVAADPALLHQLQTLPDRTVPDEADALRLWLHQLLPAAPATRVAGWQ